MINSIVKYLISCDDAYYNTSNPLISDATYDALVETLRRLDPTNNYLRKVGVKSVGNKVGRLIPMGTLTKCHKDEEIIKWLKLNTAKEIIFSPKYDGFAVELIYGKGKLISASTRGDGHVGENVIDAILHIKNIPSDISPTYDDYVIVRGEVIIPRSNHSFIKNLGYSAMRNAVPGIVRANRIDALEYVDFIAYEFIDGFEDRVTQREYYRKYFKIEDYRLIGSEYFNTMKNRREELKNSEYDYEIDGVVLKTKEIKEDDLLNPSFMIAWKYKSNRETTVLRDIEFQLGVTGYFTPIGIFDPVEFQGAILTRASLGNITRMQNEFKGMTTGSIIEVSRRGDIIPYIESLIMVNDEGTPISELVKCPHCGELLEFNEAEPHCVNKYCPEKLRLQISQYVRSIGIKGIGDKLIRGLIDEGILTSIPDVYMISSEEILKIPRQGQSAVDKWKQLQKKKLSASELLSSYPFIDLGKKVWDTVLTKFSYQELLSLDKSSLETINFKGIGDSKINSIITQISKNRNDLVWLGNYHNVL